jgi:hypothetical protein
VPGGFELAIGTANGGRAGAGIHDDPRVGQAQYVRRIAGPVAHFGRGVLKQGAAGGEHGKQAGGGVEFDA